MSCDCDKNKCSGSNPNPVLSVDSCAGPVMFHRVTLAANLGDDTTIPPNTLPYRNVILWYQANGHTYIYSSDAIPTRIDGDAGDLSEIRAQIAELGGQLDEEREQRIESEAQLQASITELQQDLAETAQDLKELIDSVDANLDALAARQDSDFNILNEAIGDVEKQTVQKDTSVSGDASTVTITKSLGTLQEEGATATALPLPVASAEAAGVMNVATYNAVQGNSENIDSILGGAVVIDDLPAEPTQDELTLQWKATTGKTELINRASIYDETNKKVWYYYENANEWKAIDATPSFSVSIATNDAAGIVKGSTEDGQVAVEADGSMSLNGYDGLTHDIDNLSQLVDGIEVPKVPGYVYGFQTAPGNGTSPVKFTQSGGSLYCKGQGMYNSSTGALVQPTSAFNANALVPTATSAAAGVMSSADKSKLDSLLAIKSLNDSLELDENGQLSVVGGGSSNVTLANVYQPSPQTDQAYSTTYINSLFGNDINVNRRGPTGKITLGYSLTGSGSNLVAIGNNINATNSSQSVVIGGNFYTATASNVIAIGQSGYTNVSNTVLLGSQTSATRPYEVSVGHRVGDKINLGGAEATTELTRFIANVTAGERPTDAVNLQQMQDYVADAVGDIEAILTNLNTGEGV